MKKIITLFVLFFALTISSCKKAKDCEIFQANNLDVSYSTDGKIVFFAFKGSVSYTDIQMEYGASGYTAGSGTKFSNFEITDLNEGDYDVYVKRQCDGTHWSEWSQKIEFSILDSTKICFPPKSIYMVDLGCEVKFAWYPNSNGLKPDYYQVEYGLSGFTLGEGATTIVANQTSFADAVLVEGEAYDFYVKSNCSGTGWGEYSAVKSFYAAKNYNRCFVPKNVDAYRSGGNIICSFDSDGDCQFEYTLIKSSQSVGDEAISSTMSQSKSITYTGVNNFSTYHFMVRTVCKDGTKTGWFTKVIQP